MAPQSCTVAESINRCYDHEGEICLAAGRWTKPQTRRQGLRCRKERFDNGFM